jgi:hypothetical protein
MSYALGRCRKFDCPTVVGILRYLVLHAIEGMSAVTVWDTAVHDSKSREYCKQITCSLDAIAVYKLEAGSSIYR